MKLIKINTIYDEILICKLYYKNRYYFYTDKGCIPISDIKYYDIIGNIIG